MEKIILTQATVGNIVNRLKKFMENKVFTSQLIYNMKPSKVKRTLPYELQGVGKDYSRRGYNMNAEVTRHPFSKGEKLSMFDDKPMALVHIYFHEDSGMAFSEGDVFYFYGSMILVDIKDHLFLKGQSSMGDMTRVVEKYVLINSPDRAMINGIRHEYLMSEAYAKQYWQGVEEEREKEMNGELDL